MTSYSGYVATNLVGELVRVRDECARDFAGEADVKTAGGRRSREGRNVALLVEDGGYGNVRAAWLDGGGCLRVLVQSSRGRLLEMLASWMEVENA